MNGGTSRPAAPYPGWAVRGPTRSPPRASSPADPACQWADAGTSHLLWAIGRIPSVRYLIVGGDDRRPPTARGPRPSRRDRTMASLFKRAKDFAQSPQGKKLTEEVKEEASKPENRRKLKEFGQRFMKKR